jgi:hypothetical protein
MVGVKELVPRRVDDDTVYPPITEIQVFIEVYPADERFQLRGFSEPMKKRLQRVVKKFNSNVYPKGSVVEMVERQPSSGVTGG